MVAGLRKIPEPIIDPATIMVAPVSVSLRNKSFLLLLFIYLKEGGEYITKKLMI